MESIPAPQDVEDVLHARPTVGGQPPQVGAADHDRAAPSASALTTSLPRRMPPSSSTSSWPPTASATAGSARMEAGVPSRLLPPWLETERPWLRCPRRGAPHRAHDALDRNGPPLRAQPGDVGPAGGGSACTRRRRRRTWGRLAGGGHVGHGEVGQAAGAEPAGGRTPAGPGLPERTADGAQVELLGDRGLPSPGRWRTTVQGDDQALAPRPRRARSIRCRIGPCCLTSRPGRTASGSPPPRPPPACWRSELRPIGSARLGRSRAPRATSPSRVHGLHAGRGAITGREISCPRTDVASWPVRASRRSAAG